MLWKILKACPAIFSLRSSNDYSDFTEYSGFRAPDSAAEMMHDNWAGIGRRMQAAIDKAGRDVYKQKAR